jgi:hypothetical protein
MLHNSSTVCLTMFDDFDRYAKVLDVSIAPEIKEYSQTVSRSNLVKPGQTCITTVTY